MTTDVKMQGSQHLQEGFRVDADRLKSFVRVPLIAEGMTEDDADIVAEVLVRTDLRGVHSHGTQPLWRYLTGLRGGAINPRGGFTVVSETPATAVIEGGGGEGHVLSYKATKLAMAKAETTGVSTVLVRNSNHFGAGGFYALMAAEAGFASLIMTSTPLVLVPTGGTRAAMGNGPLAYGFPSRDGIPVILDLAMSVTAGSVVEAAAMRGESVREGSIVDRDGLPTTDPTKVAGLLPIAGYKGYGLALMCELFGGALAGADVGSKVNGGGDNSDNLANWARVRPDVPFGVGHSFMLFKPEFFLDEGRLEDTVAEYAGELRSERTAPGVDRIYTPGEMEHYRELDYRENGIGFDEASIAALRKIASDYDCGELLEAAIH